MHASLGIYGTAGADRACAGMCQKLPRPGRFPMLALGQRNRGNERRQKNLGRWDRSNGQEWSCTAKKRDVENVEDLDEAKMLEGDLEDIREIGEYADLEDGQDGEGEDEIHVEDASQFQKLDVDDEGGIGGTSDDVFGPPALLLIGFTPREGEFFGYLTKKIVEGDENVGIVLATEDMMKGTLEQAFKAGLLYPEENKSSPVFGARKVLLFSGLYTFEVIEIIDAYKQVQLSETVFGAAVPNNWHKNLKELVKEIMDDHKKFNPGGYGPV